MLRLSLVLGLACASGSALASANCSITPFNALPGNDTSAQMLVRSGTACGAQMAVRGGGMRMTIGRQAANGTASAPTGMSFVYVPRPGFVGRDSFEADFTGELLANGKGLDMRGTAHIAVDVTVVR